jgi:hypothetical protein
MNTMQLTVFLTSLLQDRASKQYIQGHVVYTLELTSSSLQQAPIDLTIAGKSRARAASRGL